jgi:hypothetical protein
LSRASLFPVFAKVGESVTAYRYRHMFANRALSAWVPGTHVSANGRLLRDVADRSDRQTG